MSHSNSTKFSLLAHLNNPQQSVSQYEKLCIHQPTKFLYTTSGYVIIGYTPCQQRRVAFTSGGQSLVDAMTEPLIKKGATDELQKELSQEDAEKLQKDSIVDFYVSDKYLVAVMSSGYLMVHSMMLLNSMMQSSLVAWIKCQGEVSTMAVFEEKDGSVAQENGQQTDASGQKKKKKKKKKKAKKAQTEETVQEGTETAQDKSTPQDSAQKDQSTTQQKDEPTPKTAPKTASTTTPNIIMHIAIGYSDGRIQSFTFDEANKKLDLEYDTVTPLHFNEISAIEYRGDSKHIVTTAMDYNMCQYALAERKCLFTLNVDRYMDTKTKFQSQQRIINPPHPHCLALSDSIRNTQNQQRYAVMGLGCGDILCVDLDQDIVVKWIPRAHSYVVTSVHFCSRPNQPKDELSFITSALDGQIHSYTFKIPRTIKERNAQTLPQWKVDHREQGLVYYAKKKNIESIFDELSDELSKINHVLVLDDFLVVADSSNQAYIYTKQ